MTHEITEDIFANSVKSLIPVNNESRYSYRYDVPISYTSFDHYERFNRIPESEWDPAEDCKEKERELQLKGKFPRPQFNQRNRGHKIVPIEEILDEPGRTLRPEK